MTMFAKSILIGLIALSGSVFSGCAGKDVPRVPAAPVRVKLQECPKPHKPDLPLLDRTLLSDTPRNLNIRAERDDLTRQYISGLEATDNCWRSQHHQGD